jgi:hypothetical protein
MIRVIANIIACQMEIRLYSLDVEAEVAQAYPKARSSTDLCPRFRRIVLGARRDAIANTFKRFCNTLSLSNNEQEDEARGAERI